MKNKKALLSFFISIFFIIIFSKSTSGQNVKKVSREELKNWISYLSSDEMRGRANGSPEMKIAASWIADKFREYGVKPLLPDGNYLQNYTYTGRDRTVEEKNVLGIIQGSDPQLKDQYLFITAHFDHIGIRRGASPDSICNGADDNAAGTCTLIAIAKEIFESGLKPGRTLVFAAFSGEESGTRGSMFFISHLPVPVENIYADINFEMIGHSESFGKNNFYMTGCKQSNLDDVIKTFPDARKISLIDTVSMADQLFYASDNIAFSIISAKDGVMTGIPSGTFATTTMSPYIHTPRDEASLFDFDNMAELTDYFSRMVVWLSKNHSEIVWTDPKFVRPKN
jgi:Zn-dependent M28 family amino/carboxypeptidase